MNPMDELVRRAAPPADADRERLLSFITHEVRNPLASGLWAAEMLARPGLDPARAERLGKLAMRSLRRLRTLTEDYFALERVPSQPPEGQTNLREAIEKALAPRDLDPGGIAEASLAPDASPEVEVAIHPGLADRLLYACARRMGRAGEGGPIEVSFGAIDGRVEVRFLRAGLDAASIDPPELRSGGSEGEGTTFALLLARSIVQVIGGALRVEDVSAGACLFLELPIAR